LETYLKVREVFYPYCLAILLLVFLTHSMKIANTNSLTSLSSISLQNSLTSPHPSTFSKALYLLMALQA
jgi:hypothetical protein